MARVDLRPAEYAKVLYISLVHTTAKGVLTKKEFVPCVGKRLLTQRTTNRHQFDLFILVSGDVFALVERERCSLCLFLI